MIAHDLRNPLGAIVMSAQYLLRSEALCGPEAIAAGRIPSSASTMEKMVRDLLDFTQVRMGGQLRIEPIPMSVRDVCEDAVGELRAFHPDRRSNLRSTARSTVIGTVRACGKWSRIWSPTPTPTPMYMALAMRRSRSPQPEPISGFESTCIRSVSRSLRKSTVKFLIRLGVCAKAASAEA